MPKDRSIADQLESSEYGVLSLKRHQVKARSFCGIFLVFMKLVKVVWIQDRVFEVHVRRSGLKQE